MARRRKILTWMVGGLLVIFSLIYLLPYVWMTSMSFNRFRDLSGNFPKNPTLEQYYPAVQGL